MRSGHKIAVGLLAAALATAGTITASSAAPEPATVSAPSKEAGEAVAARVLAASDPTAAVAALSPQDAASLLLARPLKFGPEQVTESKQVSGPKAPALRRVSETQMAKAATTRAKHPLRCWELGIMRQIRLPVSAVFWPVVGNLRQKAYWCHNGERVSANWRDRGGKITYPGFHYAGNTPRVRNVVWEIRMATEHKIVFEPPIVPSVDFFPCTQQRLGDGRYSLRADCYLGEQ